MVDGRGVVYRVNVRLCNSLVMYLRPCGFTCGGVGLPLGAEYEREARLWRIYAIDATPALRVML